MIHDDKCLYLMHLEIRQWVVQLILRLIVAIPRTAYFMD